MDLPCLTLSITHHTYHTVVLIGGEGCGFEQNILNTGLKYSHIGTIILTTILFVVQMVTPYTICNRK